MRVTSTIRMLFDTTMPVIMITPISDMTFSVVPVTSRKRITPVMPDGIASRMMKGSMNDANCAIRIRYTSTIASSRPTPKLLNDCCMASTDPAYLNANVGRKLGVLDDLLDFLRDTAQVLALGRDVDVDHAEELVVVDLGRSVDHLDVGHVLQHGGVVVVLGVAAESA